LTRRIVSAARQEGDRVHWTIDDRAASIFLLIGGQLNERQALPFIDLLAERQIGDSDAATEGSFLFQKASGTS
jgi:hypothetical protein